LFENLHHDNMKDKQITDVRSDNISVAKYAPLVIFKVHVIKNQQVQTT